MAFGWNDLWLRPDQQAAHALQAGEPARAAQLARDPSLRGTAEYQAGNYDAAQQVFATQTDADAHYNQGNALAQLQRYEEAIAAYDRALEKQPGMEDALHNKAEIEKLLQQQQEQEQQQQGQQGESGEDTDNQQGQQGESGENADNQQGQQNQEAEDNQQNAQGEAGDDESQNEQQNAAGAQDDEETAGSQQDAASSAAEQSQAGRDESAEGMQPSAEAQAADVPGDEPLPEQPDEDTGQQQAGEQLNTAEAQPLDSEEQRAAEQWLRRIPDDPGGLLRRKFLYQYQQRAGRSTATDQPAW
jgi:Ca-activated chloride channel family protein